MVRKKRKYTKRASPSIRELTATRDLKALATWANTLKGCLRFLTQLKGLKPGPGDGWAVGNRDYYLKRVRQLLDNVPKGAETVAYKARKLLAELE